MTVSNLHLEEIREFDVPIPAISEQSNIALYLVTYDSRIRSEEVAREKLKLLKAGLRTIC